jgi:hypothetical protein
LIIWKKAKEASTNQQSQLMDFQAGFKKSGVK